MYLQYKTFEVPIKKRLQKFLPNRQSIQKNRYIGWFGDWLGDPDLWHINKYGIARGIAVGLFCAYLPMPLESAVAIALAILFRANLAAALMFVWVSNPLTWPILYGSAYLLGAWILNKPDIPAEHVQNFAILAKNHYLTLWLGCLIIGPVVSLCSYFATLWAWELHIMNKWKNRKRGKYRRKDS